MLNLLSELISTAVLAYTLGLRHALEADDISVTIFNASQDVSETNLATKAIDLMTRRLIASGQRPVTVGTFFSLGHSTIVIITSIVVAATSSAISSKFDTFSQVGSIIGTSVSAGFLILLGAMNIYILIKLVNQMHSLIAHTSGETLDLDVQGAGCLFYLFRKLFRLIDRYFG